jgi:hypothetical protein
LCGPGPSFKDVRMRTNPQQFGSNECVSLKENQHIFVSKLSSSLLGTAPAAAELQRYFPPFPQHHIESQLLLVVRTIVLAGTAAQLPIQHGLPGLLQPCLLPGPEERCIPVPRLPYHWPVPSWFGLLIGCLHSLWSDNTQTRPGHGHQTSGLPECHPALFPTSGQHCASK